ncbi:transcription factor FapR [Garciella nitratireducens]|uniref:DeoR-like helix-turn-helix domain-containing protein n=1 Tax=Garciella nitratireducens DSM 15102 TaxID=1121911 RepID=A0A1T4JYK6_9FIRM|nr:transcription factor FapR [Garciella nitratireducens]RBP41126.1 DeoR-like protein with HTH domain [Garciella nitratireducens]SJZ35199.1 DeoR-like helix-turn-helix domain-containing protein [Garciella nitratireducens DSM 15102]
MKKVPKKIRQVQLQEKLKKDPFLTDEELSELFSVSIQTIRLDRLELGIPELRERIKNMAKKNLNKVKSLHSSEVIGELVEMNLGQSAISIFETTKQHAFEKTKVIKGQYIYSLAESLAIAVIDAQVALVGVANIKYKKPVKIGQKLIAKAEVVKKRGNNKYFVWVKIQIKNEEVFRGKFILVTFSDDKDDGGATF